MAFLPKIKSRGGRVTIYLATYYLLSFIFALFISIPLSSVYHNSPIAALGSLGIGGWLAKKLMTGKASVATKYSLNTDLEAKMIKWVYIIPIVVLALLTLLGLESVALFMAAPILSFATTLVVISKGKKISKKQEDKQQSNQYSENSSSYKYTTPTAESEIMPPKNAMPTFDEDTQGYVETSHGAAAWVSDNSKDTNNTTGKGLWIGGGFFHHKEGNLVSVAPPGTGKGAALIIPNLLLQRDYKHSFVVFDPKGTNACITARFQKNLGKNVVIIDPTGLQKMSGAKHGILPSSFNPLDFVKNDVFNGTGQIVNLLLPDDPKAEKYWNSEARNLMQTILTWIVLDQSLDARDKNLVKLYSVMMTTSDFEDLFISMLENKGLDDNTKTLAASFANMAGATDKTMFNSVKSVANASLKWLGNPSIQNCMKTSSFDPRELEEGGTALYLCQPIQNKEAFATFSRLIIGFCLRANSMPSAKPKSWVYYLLDEFPTMGIFPEIVEALAYSREYKMRLWIFAQSLSQLDIVYTLEGRNQILGNSRVFQAFGVTDQVTQQYVSQRIGNRTKKIKTESHTTGENTGTSTNWGRDANSAGQNQGKTSSSSSNWNYVGVPLIEPSAVEYDPHIITLCELGPTRLVRWQYWHDSFPKWSKYYRNIFTDGRADPNPNFN